MNPLSTASAAVSTSLLEGFSLEMTGKDVPKLEEARDSIPQGTRINVTFLGNENLAMRLEASRAVKRLGFVPVPHISARRLGSQGEFEEFLAALRADGTGANVFTVGGDPTHPEGPYEDALALIETGLLREYGVRHVSISGYPEGHPDIAGDVLWSALREKSASIAGQELDGSVITQFGFDVDPVLDWLEKVRAEGITLPVRIGVPGPAGVRRLMSYAARFGVGTSASIAKKYGLSITNLMGTAGPDKFLRALADGYDPARHGDIKIHFYTFGGLRATSEWVAQFRKDNLV
ncbi:methylenetetrahydrofolate reductase [Streptomyces sp. NRRL F-525]|uniref:methylenetetrahydrofolate reductase n=1 Tax=Streptomyces sp. NRRL F-525 TaxID=1463861 RepID=UPI00068E02E7|nr:methylenetetrahydrofolate reductase [Streptomyces sp. NRRL F-525]